MANINDKATVEFIVNNSQAKQKLEEVNRLLLTARDNLKAATASGDTKGINKYTKEIIKLEQEQRKMESRTQTIRRALENMDKAKPKELKQTIKEINAELNSGAVERNSKEWKDLQEKLRQCKAELKGIQEEGKAAKEELGGGGIAEWGKKWVGFTTIVSQATWAFSAATNAMRSYVEEYADMAEHMADVTKYTGLAKEDVDELNESFKKMDTRTSRQALNDLAADAGRLGIQSKQQVLDFVEAANQINVALGEDLGEDAVKNIGKLAQMFGDADSMGLKKAMLATGSVINDLAQSSSANEGICPAVVPVLITKKVQALKF